MTRPDVTALRIRYDLCDLCTAPRGDRHHSPGYRMDRSPYDIPGHAFVDPLDGYDHDPSGRGCALAGAVFAGDDDTSDFCRPCYADLARSSGPAPDSLRARWADVKCIGPSGTHSLYAGAAGGLVCVWCHYGDDLPGGAS